MTTLRIISGSNRVSTAVVLPDGRVLQVYPSRQMFQTQADWQQLYQGTLVLEEPKAKPKKKTLCEKRREKEILEFLDSEYKWMFKSLEIHGLPDLKILVVLHDDSHWEIQRDLDFLKNPPSLKKNGVALKTEYEWYPCLTTIRWLMMNAFLEPESI